MSSVTTGGVTLSSKSCRVKFARRFLRSLKQIQNQKRPAGSSSSSSEEEICNRRKRIKMAAYTTMARAVGPRMNWSRALLFKLWKPKTSTLVKKTKKKRVISLRSSNNKKQQDYSRSECSSSAHIERSNKKLRKLVPGGESMGLCTLLEETAHYITCLNTQVKVMQAIAHNLDLSI